MRNPTFDNARALCMIYIICLWHLCDYTDSISLNPWGAYVKNACLGAFMFISGFLLSNKYIIGNKQEAITFIKKRILRIYPLYFLSVTILFLFKSINTKCYLISVCCMNTFIKPQIPTLWFISLLFFFYLIFVFVTRLNTKRIILISLLIYGIMYVIKICFGGIERRFFYYLPCFILGVVLAKTKSEIWNSALCAIVSFAVFFLISFFLQYTICQQQLIKFVFQGILATSGTLTIMFISNQMTLHDNNTRFSELISFISMAAYMFHRQIYSFFRSFVFWPDDGFCRLLYLIFICIPVIFVVSYVIQWSYDKITNELFHNTTSCK